MLNPLTCDALKQAEVQLFQFSFEVREDGSLEERRHNLFTWGMGVKLGSLTLQSVRQCRG